MEIKELTPKHKEIVSQSNNREGTFFDTFSYAIQNGSRNGQSEGKNYLYIVSQAHSKDPSLDYLPNLVATFIKREVESNEDFEISLKKANELIENIIKENTETKLDLGVALIKQDKISVSKVGKAKMLLARGGNGHSDSATSRKRLGSGEGSRKAGIASGTFNEKPFDVFQNVTQFSKSPSSNKRFSNIISGDLKNKDRLFFFIPGPKLNHKQKHISSNLVKEEQAKFAENVGNLISNVPFCGIHLEINEEIKKISRETNKETPKPQIVATEVSRINKGDAIKNMIDQLKNSILGKNVSPAGIRLNKRRDRGPLFLIAAAVIILVGLLTVSRFSNSEFKEELAAAGEKIKIAESRFLLKQNYDARKVVNEAVNQLENIKDKDKSREVLAAAMGLLNRIEKTNTSIKPEVFSDLSELEKEFTGFSVINRIPILYDSERIYEFRNGVLNEIWDLAQARLLWTKNGKVAIYDGAIKTIDLEQRKISEIRKRFDFEPLEMKNYQDNLYFLGPKNIYKISNALIDPIEELEWLKQGTGPEIEGNLISFSLDSSIYALTDARKLITLFKGETVSAANLDFDVRQDTELIHLGNDKFLIVENADRIARVVGADGNLQESYDLSEINTIKDMRFDQENSTLYILSPDKIWRLEIQN